tara:strand:+ start:463 stop:1116 length:654 start_codon:yes stop_codon:yes gene_type:complete
MINLKNYDVFIFDCDGVILDSNSLKSEAFRMSLSDEDTKKVDELVLYHKQNGGISRYKKFDYFFNKIAPSRNSKTKIENALTRFAEIVSKEMLRVDTIPGIEVFLSMLHKQNKRLFVNSGSDEKELREIFKKRDLSLYFEDIFGSPSSKSENLERIDNFPDISSRSLFFGDSISDFQASKSYDIDFVFISGYSEWQNPFPTIDKTFKDFEEILGKLH